MSFKYSTGSQPISSTIASIAGGTGLTTFTITSATGLPTIGSGEFGTLRIADGTANAETLTYSLSGTTVTCSPTGFAHANGDAVAFDIISAAALDQIKEDAISGYPENLLTTGGALVKGGGVTNRITITTAQTFTLANGTYKGELCRYRVDRTSTNLATIDPAGSTTIDGALTRILRAGEWGSLAWTGTEWEKIAGLTIPMAANLGLSANITSFPNTADTLIALDVVTHDDTGLMANATTHVITIRRPGRYELSSFSGFNLTNAGNNCMGILKRNGTNVSRSSSAILAGGYASYPEKVIVQNCAVGDQITTTAYQNSGAGAILTGTPELCRMEVNEIPTW